MKKSKWKYFKECYVDFCSSQVNANCYLYGIDSPFKNDGKNNKSGHSDLKARL